MTFARKVITTVTAAGLAGAGLVGAAGPAQATVLDREQKRCGAALVTAELERDSREHEVDVEVYSQRRGERWRIVIRDSDGEVLHRITRKTNREGEFDVWRSVPRSDDRLKLRIKGPNKQRCTLTLRA